MDKKEKRQNNSMFIYTALIFVVALILIILAFFGQTNLTNLRKAAEDVPASEAPSETVSETAAPQPTSTAVEELAILTNTVSNLRAENDSLQKTIDTYENLLSANGYISVGNTDMAQEILNTIDRNALSDDQKILFDQISNIINEGKEQ